MLELEFTGDTYNSNPDWNNFKISSYISWSFFLLIIKTLFMAKKQMSLEVVNPNAAGIDIGSRSHWVSVGQNSEDVKEYGVYSEDHQKLCEWLKKHKVSTIAMESTGTYWQNLFSSLVACGFDVISEQLTLRRRFLD